MHDDSKECRGADQGHAGAEEGTEEPKKFLRTPIL